MGMEGGDGGEQGKQQRRMEAAMKGNMRGFGGSIWRGQTFGKARCMKKE
jgi:hypothetical protein